MREIEGTKSFWKNHARLVFVSSHAHRVTRVFFSTLEITSAKTRCVAENYEMYTKTDKARCICSAFNNTAYRLEFLQVQEIFFSHASLRFQHKAHYEFIIGRVSNSICLISRDYCTSAESSFILITGRRDLFVFLALIDKDEKSTRSLQIYPSLRSDNRTIVIWRK